MVVLTPNSKKSKESPFPSHKFILENLRSSQSLITKGKNSNPPKEIVLGEVLRIRRLGTSQRFKTYFKRTVSTNL
ncbi:hypothetical protein ACS0TY_026538 [Phlomoides rotata]